MNLKDFLEAVNYKVTGGEKYQWLCYGPDARYIDSEVRDHYSSGIVFDTETQVVYEVSVYDEREETTVAFRWSPLEYVKKRKAEAKKRGVDDSICGDELIFIDLEVEEDMMEKLTCIVNNVPYDPRVTIPLRMSDEDMFILMKLAHTHDITLNKMVEQILETTIALKKSKKISKKKKKSVDLTLNTPL